MISRFSYGYTPRVTLVTMSEFGRRVEGGDVGPIVGRALAYRGSCSACAAAPTANCSGTDHGHGNAMLIDRARVDAGARAVAAGDVTIGR